MNQLARAALSTLVLVLGFGFASSASAAVTFNETVVHDTTTNVEITLDDTTVLCSAADYGALYLKVLIPELAALTLLDHQNTGAGAPCVAAGMCEPGNEPADIIDPSCKTETVAINVKAIRGDNADSVAQTCETVLIERVTVNIRGTDFFHERSASLGSRPFADCVTSQMVQPDQVEPDDKSDTPAYIEEPGGGCSATGSGSGATFVFLLALAMVRRRQR